MEDRINNFDELKRVASNITSVADYLEVLKYIKRYLNRYSSKETKSLFFRGSSNASWNDEPSIYRKNSEGKSQVEYEHKLFYEIISRCPEDFRHCNNTLEHLVMMQHYGLPTRLLDITENPLVALFFACQNHTTKTDAKVTIYQVPDSEIKNYNSDTAAMIANLSRLDRGFNSLLLYCKICLDEFTKVTTRTDFFDGTSDDHLISVFITLGEMFKNNRNNTKKYLLIRQYFQHCYRELESKEYIPKDYSLIKDLYREIETVVVEDSVSFETIREVYSISRDFSGEKILHFIQEEKSYFDADKMRVWDFEKVIVIKTKQDNPNIIKQNGAFLLFGVERQSLNKMECAKVPNNYYFSLQSGQNEKIACLIRPKYKKEILNELQSLSISESYLFPDISHVANELKTKYIA